MIVVGKEEVEKAEVAVRSRQKGDEGTIPLDIFKQRIQNEIKTRYNDALEMQHQSTK